MKSSPEIQFFLLIGKMYLWERTEIKNFRSFGQLSSSPASTGASQDAGRCLPVKAYFTTCFFNFPFASLSSKIWRAALSAKLK